MAYLTAHRYGLRHVELSLAETAGGWETAWTHPSGLRAIRHPVSGRWHVSDGQCIVDEGWSSSLRAAALRIERMTQSHAR